MGGRGSIGRFTLNLPFPYIFLLFDCFKWALIDCIEKHRVHSALQQFRMGGRGSIGRFTLNLPFPYIFLLFDCFKWALIDCIEKHRVHSALQQFRMGGRGSIGRFTLNLPFPYIFLLFDCFKWALIDCIEKHRVHSALQQFRMGGGGVNWQIYPKSAHFLISSYYLTVSNGHSLTALKSIEFTQHSSSFEWGEGGSIGRFTLNLPDLSSQMFSCAHQ